MMTKQTRETVDQFIEQMGLLTQADGLPRIAGKIFGLLLIETGPYSFSDLAARLCVSRGSVSTNTRLLENLGVIDRVSKLGERGDYFQLGTDPYNKLMHGIHERMGKSLAVVQAAQANIPQSWQESHKRLRDIEYFYSEYHKSTQELIKRLSKT